MYSGTTLTRSSGRLVGAHQKFDRLARQHIAAYLTSPGAFPSAKRILRFEGLNGPDGIKRKSPAQNEPWHYFSPFDESDQQLFDVIDGHYRRLVKALRKRDDVVAAFEAAWLAHAIVDGLTPAHHYPYEEKLDELRGGRGKETRTTIKDKLVLPGDSHAEMLSNNWKMWGPKGLLTTHGSFELGVAMLILPLSLRRARPAAEDLREAIDMSAVEYFGRTAREVAALGMYDAFYETGWTARLARQVRRQLAPTIVRAVSIIWYKAALDAGVARTPRA